MNNIEELVRRRKVNVQLATTLEICWVHDHGDIRLWLPKSFYEVTLDANQKRFWEIFDNSPFILGLAAKVEQDYKVWERNNKNNGLDKTIASMRAILEKSLPSSGRVSIDSYFSRIEEQTSSQTIQAMIDLGDQLKSLPFERQIEYFKAMIAFTGIPGQRERGFLLRRVTNTYDDQVKRQGTKLAEIITRSSYTRSTNSYEAALSAAGQMHRHLKLYYAEYLERRTNRH